MKIEQTFSQDSIKVLYFGGSSPRIEIRDLEDQVLWQASLAQRSASFRSSIEGLFQVGKYQDDGREIFEVAVELSPRKGQCTFILEAAQNAETGFIGIADLRDGRVAHHFDLVAEELEIAFDDASGIAQLKFRAPLAPGADVPAGYESYNLDLV